MDLIKLANELHNYLVKEGVEFNEEGFPIFREGMILNEFPEQILPINSKFAAKDKSKTLLVHFSKDENIYKRLFALDRDISMYKQFMGFGGFDLSPRINWDLNLQRFNIALNMMADAYLALHGIKLMPNFRTGCLKTFSILTCYPKNSWYIVGTLGCSRGHVQINEMYLRTKILMANPQQLIFYGMLKEEYRSILNEYGISYKVYADFQRVSRGKEMIA